MSERKILIIMILIFAAFVFVILSSAARGEDLYVLCKPGSVVNVRRLPAFQADQRQHGALRFVRNLYQKRIQRVRIPQEGGQT